ncbi:inactive peptidyl-prolyl cis-trans isomerase FKBP6 isoform X2 [Chrysemys picta bellii]|uniref:inactive peptidyl-prolyl cis-trans isomerase FKBP6 isoform X2 n=1 Tax=Chrysemys picta bellii TaxID=8478 RepID=UPI0032B1A41E
MQDITGDRGVLKEVIRAGAGEIVPQDASVLVKYSGYLEYMDKPFDTNWYRRNPRLMKLGEEITLQGMEVGLLTMKKGESARFLFTPSYAYGALGCPPLIPPNATVLFEMELLDFLDSAECDKFFVLTTEQQDTFPLQQVLKVANTEREFGNYLFRQKRFMDARERYKRASSILCRRPSSGDEQCQIDAAKLLVFLNLSFTYLKLERPVRALTYGEKALEIDERNAKALFRCGQACLSLTEYEKARDFLVRAQKEQPFNHDINNELKKLARCELSKIKPIRYKISLNHRELTRCSRVQVEFSCYRDYMDKEKEMCCRMFAPLSFSPVEPEIKCFCRCGLQENPLHTSRAPPPRWSKKNMFREVLQYADAEKRERREWREIERRGSKGNQDFVKDATERMIKVME